jgi:hypothetical protein
MKKRITKKERDEYAKLDLYYCSKCKRFLPKSDFHKNKCSRFGICYECKICNKKRRSPKFSLLNQERKQKAKENLYYCKLCERYLPPQFFPKNTLSAFGLRSECKLCLFPPENRSMIVHLEIPRKLKEDIRRLGLYDRRSLQHTLLKLIINGLKNG